MRTLCKGGRKLRCKADKTSQPSYRFKNALNLQWSLGNELGSKNFVPRTLFPVIITKRSSLDHNIDAHNRLTQERERGIGAHPLRERWHRHQTSQCDQGEHVHPVAEQHDEDSCERKSGGDGLCNLCGKRREI